MACELPKEIVEELGLLLNPKDIGAARATCSAWRNHLAQRVGSAHSANLLEVLASADQDTWLKRVQSLSRVFPALKQLLVYAGGRVGPQVFDAELSVLAATIPQLLRLEVRFLQPTAGSGGPSWPGVGQPLQPLPCIPSGLRSLTQLTHLALVMCADPSADQATHLPTSLLELRIATAYDTQGLNDTSLRAIGQQLPCLRYLETDIASYNVSAEGLGGLPHTLTELKLCGVLALGRDEVKVLCEQLTHLQRLTLEIPSDRHEMLVTLSHTHPSLTALEITLNQDEADHDPTLSELMSSMRSLAQGTQDTDTEGGNLTTLSYSHSSSLHTYQRHGGLLTSLTLQSVNLPAQQGHGSPLLSTLATLTSLTHLCIAEPWVEGGHGAALTGSLTELSTLTRLKTCVVSLMPGFPIPALHVTAQVIHCFARHCTSLIALTALNSIDPDTTCISTLSQLSRLETLVASPAACGTHTPLPALDIAWLPRQLTLLSLSSFILTHTATVPSVTTVCEIASGHTSGEAAAGEHTVNVPGVTSACGTASEADMTAGAGDGQLAVATSQTGVTAGKTEIAQGTESVAPVKEAPVVQAAAKCVGMSDVCGCTAQRSVNESSAGLAAAAAVTAETVAAAAAAGSATSQVAANTAAAAASTDSGPSPAQPHINTPLCHIEDLVLSHVEIGEGLSPAWRLLSLCGELQSLMLRHVTGVGDDDFACNTVQLSKLTSLQVLPAPVPPPAPLTQTALSHCSRFTSLKRLEWEGWGSAGQQDDEPDIVRTLAEGARSLHVLRLCHAQDTELRAVTAQVVQDLLPLCCLGAH